MDEATRRLLALAREGGGHLTAAAVENDPWCASNQEVVSAATHALATESSVIVAEDSDTRAWFPYSFMILGDSSA